jgi:hypothetical protein
MSCLGEYQNYRPLDPKELMIGFSPVMDTKPTESERDQYEAVQHNSERQFKGQGAVQRQVQLELMSLASLAFWLEPGRRIGPVGPGGTLK